MTSVNNQVLVIIQNRKQLTVQGYCSACNTPVNRVNTVNNLPEIEKIFCIVEIHNKHLLEYLSPVSTIALTGKVDDEAERTISGVE